jgi:hypothetical protein
MSKLEKATPNAPFATSFGRKAKVNRKLHERIVPIVQVSNEQVSTSNSRDHASPIVPHFDLSASHVFLNIEEDDGRPELMAHMLALTNLEDASDDPKAWSMRLQRSMSAMEALANSFTTYKDVLLAISHEFKACFQNNSDALQEANMLLDMAREEGQSNNAVVAVLSLAKELRSGLRGNKLLGMLYSVEDHARMVAQLSESKRAMSQLVVERKQSLEKCEQLLREHSDHNKQLVGEVRALEKTLHGAQNDHFQNEKIQNLRQDMFHMKQRLEGLQSIHVNTLIEVEHLRHDIDQLKARQRVANLFAVG